MLKDGQSAEQSLTRTDVDSKVISKLTLRLSNHPVFWAAETLLRRQLEFWHSSHPDKFAHQ